MSGPVRSVIVTADDFGYAPWVDRGILAAHERGIVTATSLMVRQPNAANAVAAATAFAGLDIGLHLDLGEWAYRDGQWHALYEVVPLDDRAAIDAAVTSQLAAFRALVGRDPTHLDSHQHVHRREPVRTVAAALAAELGIPLRGETGDLAYRGTFYGQTETGAPIPGAIGVDALRELLAGVPSGWTELSCHPGTPAAPTDPGGATMYRDERAAELAVLCDPRTTAAFAELRIGLQAFRDWAAAVTGAAR